MMSAGFDAVSDARFRTATEMEMRIHREEIAELWAADRERGKQIDAITARINGAILWAAIAAAGLLFGVVRPKLGL